jgi:hypothetical protein
MTQGNTIQRLYATADNKPIPHQIHANSASKSRQPEAGCSVGVSARRRRLTVGTADRHRPSPWPSKSLMPKDMERGWGEAIKKAASRHQNPSAAKPQPPLWRRPKQSPPKRKIVGGSSLPWTSSTAIVVQTLRASKATRMTTIVPHNQQ